MQQVSGQVEGFLELLLKHLQCHFEGLWSYCLFITRGILLFKAKRTPGAEVRLGSGCTAYTLHRVIQPWMNSLKRKLSPLSRARCNRCKFIKIKVWRWHPASSLFRRDIGNMVSVVELWDQSYFSGRSETRRQGRWRLLKGRVITWESERGAGSDRITSAIAEGTKRWDKRRDKLNYVTAAER